MCDIVMVVEAQVFGRCAECEMPPESCCFPVFVPFHLFARPYKKLHFHLFELSHTEYKLTCDDFISECFSYLSNTEWNFLSGSLLYVEEIDEDALGGLWAKIEFVIFAGDVAELS